MRPRDAHPGDLASLSELEVEGFQTDRLSQRNMRRLLTTPSARLRVLGALGAVHGYYLTLFRQGSRIARLYSIVVAPDQRGKGTAEALLNDAEDIAARRGAQALRLEVREDNPRAIRFYVRRGYRKIGERPGYYADGANALRFEKALAAGDAAASTAEEDRSPRSAAVAADPSLTAARLPAGPNALRSAVRG